MEMQIKAKVKLWGNSLGVVIPRDIVLKENISENDEVMIKISKKETLEDFFGKGKGLKIDAQKMKDEIRREELASEKRKWQK